MSSPVSTKNSDQLMQEIVVRVITIAEMLAKSGEAVSVGQESNPTQNGESRHETPQKSSSSRADV